MNQDFFEKIIEAADTSIALTITVTCLYFVARWFDNQIKDKDKQISQRDEELENMREKYESLLREQLVSYERSVGMMDRMIEKINESPDIVTSKVLSSLKDLESTLKSQNDLIPKSVSELIRADIGAMKGWIKDVINNRNGY